MPPSSSLRAASLLLLVSLAALPARAQDRPAVSVYGFVRAETFFDSDRVDDAAPFGIDEQYHLYPPPVNTGAADTDRSELGFSARQTRIGVRAGGAYAFGAEVSGAVEADFFSPFTRGPEFTLRNAFVKLDWGTHEVIAGQYWSPLFTVNVFPGTVAFNAGAPFQPYARQPQLRAVWKPGAFRVIGAVAGQQGEFADLSFSSFLPTAAAPFSVTPLPSVPDPTLARRASLPLGHLHLQYVRGESVLGAGVYGKAVQPELGQDRFYAGAVQAYSKLASDRFVLAAKGTYGTDLTDHLMTGGYVGSLRQGRPTFDALRVLSGWLDVSTRGTGVTVGLFGGATANLGAADPIGAPYRIGPGGPFGPPPTLYYPGGLRASTMDWMWRAAPRISYSSGPARIALEGEVTTAYWAERTDDRFAPTGSTDAETNVRGLLVFFYFF